MPDPLLSHTGAWTCRVLDYAGTLPNACYNIDGRATIGMFTALMVFGLAMITVWRRYL